MKITIEPTTKIVELNGVPARIWEGTTEGGLSIHCLVTRVAARKAEDCGELEKALKETRPPSPEVDRSYSLRMIL